MNQMKRTLRSKMLIAIIVIMVSTLVAILVSAGQSSEPLTGNWVVRNPNADVTFRTTYLNLKQEGTRITESIRVMQFCYQISESTGGHEGFTISGWKWDGYSGVKVKYEG